MKKKREEGFYWVQLFKGNWKVLEWNGHTWNHLGACYPDESLKQIDEQKLIRNERN